MTAVEPQAPASAGIDRIYAAQRARQPKVNGSSAAERIAKIRSIERAVMAWRSEIRKAMWDDYRKPAEEVDLTEIYAVLLEARHARRHLRRWMKPQRVGAPLALLGSSSRIRHEPKGVVLIISPWNFPFNLTLGPLISAVAAGNCVVIKPSELTPNSSACMKRILAGLFDEDEVAVIEGDAAVATSLLQLKFDHIFFTGSPGVGKVVMKAAAEHLTSVTLELGGKSPVFVDRSADLKKAARKIVWGKFLNSGQVCIAPDYLLVDAAVREPFVKELREAIASMSGEGSRGWIVDERHASRVQRLLDDASASGAEIVSGGTQTTGPRTLQPTVVANVSAASAVMKEEIFGPVLPLLTYDSLDDAIALVNAGEKPLVLYVFSESQQVIDSVLDRTTSGAAVVNHTLIHFFQLNLPFGGVGQSGMGRGHGRAGFEAFSNPKGILRQHTLSAIELMFPPYNALKRRLIDLTLRFF